MSNSLVNGVENTGPEEGIVGSEEERCGRKHAPGYPRARGGTAAAPPMLAGKLGGHLISRFGWSIDD